MAVCLYDEVGIQSSSIVLLLLLLGSCVDCGTVIIAVAVAVAVAAVRFLILPNPFAMMRMMTLMMMI